MSYTPSLPIHDRRIQIIMKWIRCGGESPDTLEACRCTHVMFLHDDKGCTAGGTEGDDDSHCPCEAFEVESPGEVP